MCVFWRRAVFSFLILISLNCFSQTAVRQVNSVELLKKAVELFNKEKYQQAIQVYKEVPRTDTNYQVALYYITLSHYNDSNYAQGIAHAKQGLKMFPDAEDDWNNLIANNLEKLGQTKEALAYYDKIIGNSGSNNYVGWFNKGITYYNLKDMEEARKCFQKVLIINPYYASAHYYLGQIAYQEGNLVAALLSHVTTLLINPDHKFAGNSISMLSSIAKMSDEVLAKAATKKSWKNDDFEVVQEILTSKLALDKQYKLKAQLEDEIVRQIQVVLEKLNYNKNDKGFWMQYYVPVYQQIFKDDLFEPFIFHIFSSVDIKEVKAYMKNNKRKVESFVPIVTAYFNEIRESQVLDPALRKAVKERYFFSNNVVVGKGKVEGEGTKAIPVGPWEFYYEDGKLKSKGLLVDKQEKSGEWLFYYSNGKIKERSFFKNDKAEGKSLSYFDNGVLSSEGSYVNGELHGVYKENFYNSMPLRTSNYVAGKKQGTSKSFASNGTLENITGYKDDKQEGTETYYHKNSKVSSISNYKNGELHGESKAFYVDGSLSAEGVYIDGKRSGNWKVFHNNGSLKTSINYAAGEPDGEFKEWYNNGALMVKGVYVKGKLEGRYEDFDSDGKLFSESVYEKGRLKDLKFINKEGKTVSSISTRSGAGNLIYYDGYGNKMSEGYFTKDGERDGKTTFYYRNGKISGVSIFKKGLLDGEKISYYPNGNIEVKTYFRNDEENGYRTTYHLNGKIQQEGNVVKGVYDGLQVQYNQLGSVTSKLNYKNGDLEGYAEYYHPNRKIDTEYFYTSGWLNSFTDYDTLGAILTDVNLERGNGTYEIKHYSGTRSVKGNYSNHYLNGQHKFFFPDGSTSYFQHYKLGIRDSVVKKYYYGGQLEYEGNYKMNEKDGKWSYYHANGQLNYTDTFNNGRFNGTTKVFNDDGSLEKEISYKENRFHGEYKMYGENGQLAVVLNYEADKLISYTYEDRNGKLVPAISVKNGTADIVAYYKNGAKSIEVSFEEDVVNGSKKIFFTNGKVYVEGNRIFGNDNGSRKVYFSTGLLKKEDNFYYGNLHGVSKEFFENGKVKAEENWYNGEQHGTSRYFDNTGKLIQTRMYYYGTLQAIK